MTVENQTNRKTSLGDGVTDEFTFVFRVIAESDVKVYVYPDDLAFADLEAYLQTAGGVDYEIELDDDGSGGVVTFEPGSIPAADEIVLIINEVAMTQTADFPTEGNFNEETVETALDRVVLQNIQQQEQINRGLSLKKEDPLAADPAFEGFYIEAVAANDRAGKLMKFNDDGDGAMASSLTADDLEDIEQLVDDAQAAAATAQSAATQAGVYAGDAADEADYAQEWAVKAEDVTISVPAGGGPGIFSAYHWAQKALAAAAIALGNLTGLSVLGRASNTTGAMAAITAANDGEVLRRNGATIGFGKYVISAFSSGAATSGQVPTADGAGNAAWATPSGGGFTNGGYKAGNYYTPVGHDTEASGTTSTMTANRMYAVPFIVLSPTTFTNIGLNVNSSAAGNARFGIYNAVEGEPVNLVADLGTVSCASTGDKEATISQLLQPGLYFLAVVFSSTPVVKGIFTVDSAVTEGLLMGGGAAYGTSGKVGYYVAHTYGALPSTFGSVTQQNQLNAPLVWLRK